MISAIKEITVSSRYKSTEMKKLLSSISLSSSLSLTEGAVEVRAV